MSQEETPVTEETLQEPWLEEPQRKFDIHKLLEKTEPSFDYLEKLEEDAAEEGVHLKLADKAEIEHERLMGINKTLEKEQFRQAGYLTKQKQTKQKLFSKYLDQNRKIKYLEDHSSHKHHQRQAAVSKAFSRNEMKLKHRVKKAGGEMKVHIDDESEGQLLFGGGQRMYKVEWKGRPQPIEVRVEEVREVKDKLDRGEYTIKVLVKDRIGGKVLNFRKKEDEWNNVTDPYSHDGKYSSKVMKYQSTLLTLAPSKLDISPTMVLNFQLQHVSGVVVGEGYFPLLNNIFDLVEGKFKLPLLRGAIKNSIDKFEDIEDLYRKNIDEWLCNLYFQVHKRTPLLKGEKDVTVHLMSQERMQEVTEVGDLEPLDYEELIMPEQYQEFRYSVVESGVLTTPKDKFNYLASQIYIELGFRNLKHIVLYLTLLVLLLTIYGGRFVHYTGQWLFLKAEGIPVTEFRAEWDRVVLEYPNQNTLYQEIGIVLSGPTFSLLWFMFLVGVAYSFCKFVGRFPHALFRVIECYGISVVFDPFITLVECLVFGVRFGEWDGDTYRLYNYFEEREGNGVIGLMMTLFLYIGTIGVCMFFFYNYFLFVHMNGRLLDMYLRINSEEKAFFIPNDSEVSRQYVEWVCYKARNYRSIYGDSRKVVTTSYEFSDPVSPKLFQTSLHVVIYNVGNDRSRSLYRHFLRLGNGAICELGDLGSSQNDSMSQMLRGSDLDF